MTVKTMIAARVHERGVAKFSLDSVPVPAPGPGQVLVRVESASVNFSDIKRRRGDAYPFETEFPFIPGGEIAGTIAAHGPGVGGPPVGSRILTLAGTNGFGGYAQYALANAQMAIPLPAELTFDAACTLLIAGSTAKVMLIHSACLQAGESVLIPAATGGVGSFAVQIAKQMGAGKIIAVAGSDSKSDLAFELGADAFVNYTKASWTTEVLNLTEGHGADVCLEASGGTVLADTLRCLAPFGRLVVFGAASGIDGFFDSTSLRHLLYAPAPNQCLYGFNIGDWFMRRPEVAGAAFHELVVDVLSGRIRLPAIRALPLANASEAHNLLEQRKLSGKVVLKPWA